MEIEKILDYSNLFSIYSNVLPNAQKEVLSLFYFDNVGISEIAELRGTSRQAVKDCLIKGEKTLLNFENKLNLYKKFKQVEEFANKNLSKNCSEKLISILEKGEN